MTPSDKSAIDQLTANQTALDGKIGSLSSAVGKIKALATGIETIPLNETGIVGNDTITDTTPGDKNYQTQSWVLNYSNKLQPLTKRVVADPIKSENVSYFGSLADASNKLPIITLTIQFQSPSHFEFSTGLIVPVTPYHSYAKSSDSSGNPTVSETKTYAVDPIALVHYRLSEFSTRQERSAFFLTGGVGINSATSQVEFGAGATYAYRSLAIDFLADIGRDTQLGGGLTPNGPLGHYAAPPTTPVWGVRFAPGFSVRIPLGGGSSSGK